MFVIIWFEGNDINLCRICIEITFGQDNFNVYYLIFSKLPILQVLATH